MITRDSASGPSSPGWSLRGLPSETPLKSLQAGEAHRPGRPAERLGRPGEEPPTCAVRAADGSVTGIGSRRIEQFPNGYAQDTWLAFESHTLSLECPSFFDVSDGH